MKRTFDRDLLLLDTHVWLWLVAGSSDLSTGVRDAIDWATTAGALRIAAISLWEVALLASRGRIVLGKSIGLWLDEALADPGPAIDPLTPQIAVVLEFLVAMGAHDRFPPHTPAAARTERQTVFLLVNQRTQR